jgi:transcription-repair coupling factor (superfamily II helicase)
MLVRAALLPPDSDEAKFPAVLARWLRHPALARWVEEAWSSGSGVDLDGVPASAQAFLLAALTGGEPRSPVLALARNVKAQEELANDLEAWGVPFEFFPQIEPRSAAALPDQELAAERLAVLDHLAAGQSGLVLATREGAGQGIPTPDAMRRARVTFSTGQKCDRDAWIARLEASGYQREAEVTEHGAFSVRGAILDLFSWNASQPVRLEWFDDEIESIRLFDPQSQVSSKTILETTLSLLPPHPEIASAKLRDYLGPEALEIRLSCEASDHSGDGPALLPPDFFAHDFLHAPRGDFIMQEKRLDLFIGHLEDWILENWEIAIFCNNEGEQKRLAEILHESSIDPAVISFFLKPLLRGFLWPEGRLAVLSDAEIFGRYQTMRALRRQERLVALRARQAALDFSDITEGDYVVHLHHGIALYRGLETLPASSGGEAEVLALEFAEAAKLYVPLEQAFLVSKYVGVGKKHPPLDTLGGLRWERAKTSARRAVLDYASELLRIQAERSSTSGHAFPSDTPWQAEFESAFVYQETEDQIGAIDDVKRDMESTRPMDRLICGDVGFGKTEVAIRAIFKCVMDGKQAALLVPTTVLAQQHYQTLRERFADYPIRVELLSRFRSASEQRQAIAAIAAGKAEVVVGTHRLISKDVVFHDLGLVVVDEEQRFGVRQKEILKQRFRLVDVMSLSATPIPRTLYLSLTGARDLSTIETPPPNRVAVETIVAPYDERTIREAIGRELARNGQVYFLHNRIQSIHGVRERLRFLAPKARIDIGHGQMDEGELEEVMRRFVAGETDILLSTTIIESGLDIPNANTILIDRADQFGLADLYQLRGRVGRAQHKAYAYLLLPRHLMSVGDARKRVNAIKQYSHLGAGFKIAMRDLEIRGAGNLLGTEQSGHITAVGFDLYCQLLKSAIAGLKGELPPPLRETHLSLDFLVFQETDAIAPGQSGAYLPRRYIKEGRWRIEGYRRLAELRSAEELSALVSEWKDRFGPLPPPAQLLVAATELRILAASRKVSSIETNGEKLVLKRRDDFVMIGGKFPRLTETEPLPKLLRIKNWLASLS